MEEKHLNYVLKHFTTVYQLPDEVLQALQQQKCKVTWPKSDADFFTENVFLPSFEKVDFLGTEIPLLFAEKAEIFSGSPKGIHLNFDFTAACFYFLSGYQDFHSLKKSNRFRSRDAYQYRLQAHRQPLVNYYFEMLKQALEKAYKIEIPTVSKRPILFLSHDIDNMSRGWLECGYAELKSFRVLNAAQILLKKIFGRDEWDNLDQIMHLEEVMGVHSTFFLLARKGKENADYDITKKKYNKWIALLQGRSFEVGIHGSKGTHRSATALGADLKRLKNRVFGNRFHFLHFRPQTSYRALEKNKIMYDSSMGFYDEVGFRNAYCYPFRPWHFEEDRPVEFVELPLMVMDTTLEKQKYLFRRKAESTGIIYDILREVKRFNGMCSILWHNNYFSDYKYTGWREVYVESIKNAKGMDYKSKTGYLIAEEFLKRGL